MNAAHEKVVLDLVRVVMVGGDLNDLERFYVPRMVPVARGWIEPFRAAFPDVDMTTVHMVSDESALAARFRCSGTHLGPWRGHPPTGRRFENVDEAYFFTFRGDLIERAWGVEDTLDRFRQLRLDPR
ncbi:ester cyclase [Occultella aeris]|uniref:SnoaL-like polyketide cyclase n=1 Tax=Occultella aeris TaxID=2761496 RepID=A0A7M4DJH0_9MICO|nr:ester cyclase [Occultella aeris]VZO37184.1 SnoaL-like polyketide cyclase [Occultella aeris]